MTQNFAAGKSVHFSAPYMTLRHALLYDRTMVAQEINGGAAAMKDKLAFLAIAIYDSCTTLQECIIFYFIQNAVAFSVNELLSITYKD